MFKRSIVVAVAALVVLQFVRPAKNLSADSLGPDSLVERLAAPPEIRALLATSCNDCHTDNTRYPWYAEVQPAGWFLSFHIRDAKDALNLSHFGQHGPSAQAKRLQHMIDAVEDREMPLRSYTWLHRDAVLTDAQVRAFTSWAASAREKLGAE